MKPIDRGEVLGLADYEQIREPFRSRIIAEKKIRRVKLGALVSVLFENRDTVLLQIQEMLRTERITRAQAVAHEIETYNEQVPGQDELSCTLMIEIEDAARREAFLKAGVGFENHVWLVVGGQRVRADSPPRSGQSSDRTTAVHYLKFRLPTDVAAKVRAFEGTQDTLEMAIETDHPTYVVREALSSATAMSLRDDLRD